MKINPFTKPSPLKGSFDWLINEASQKGYIYADTRFLHWVDINAGKPVGDLIRQFLTNTKEWMAKNKISTHQISLNELMNYSLIGHNNISEVKEVMVNTSEKNIQIETNFSNNKLGSDGFKKWFGQSTITENGESGGKPLAVYHGTSSQFTEIKPSSHGEYGPGIYLSFSESSASKWGAIAGGKGGSVNVLSFYLKMEKPYHTTKLDLIELTLEEDDDGEPIGMREVHRRLKADGYDGIIGTGLVESDVQIIAFESSQVKLTDSIADTHENPPDSHPVVYHGTPNSFDSFDTYPVFFTTEYSIAKAYANNQYAREGETGDPRVIAATISLNNPKVFTREDLSNQFPGDGDEIDWYQFEQSLKDIEENGFDGVIIRSVMDYAGTTNGQRIIKEYDQYIAFKQNQIQIINPDFVQNQEEQNHAEFMDWFSGSAIVNEDGTPRVLYHGSRPGNDIHSFWVSKHDGAYFTPDLGYAEGYVEGLFEKRGQFGSIYPVYLSIKNPYIVKTEPDTDEWERFVYRGLDKELLEKEGFDSAILYLDGELDQVMAFYPEQIRFALSNNFDFDQASSHEISKEINAGPKPLQEASLMIYIGENYPRLVKATETLLEKGRLGEKGGISIINSMDLNESQLDKALIAGANYGLHEESGTIYLLSEHLSLEQGAAIVLQKITHNVNTKVVYDSAENLISNKDEYPDVTKSFIEKANGIRLNIPKGEGGALSLGCLIRHAIVEHLMSPTIDQELEDNRAFGVNW